MTGYKIHGNPTEAERRLGTMLARFLESEEKYAALLVITFPATDSNEQPVMMPVACNPKDGSIITRLADRIHKRMPKDLHEILHEKGN